MVPGVGPGEPRIGLALGGGAAQALAQIPVLEAFDDLGLKPRAIAGTSMGAVIGAVYAAGMTGAEMRAYASEIFRNRADFLARLWRMRPRRLSQVSFGVGQYDLERVLAAFLPDSLPEEFAGLRIPLTAVATDYYAGCQAVLREGPLIPALAASAAVPVVFRPVTIGGRVMVDGGVCNPLPFDLLAGMDIVVAIDVVTGPSGNSDRIPGSIQSLIGSASLLMRSVLAEKLKANRPPDILLRLPTGPFNSLDFAKAATIIKAGERMKDEFKEQLGGLVAR